VPSQPCVRAQGSPPAAKVGEHRDGLIHYRPDPRPPEAAGLILLTPSFPFSCDRTHLSSVHPLNSSDRGQAHSAWARASPGCERSPRPPRAPRLGSSSTGCTGRPRRKGLLRGVGAAARCPPSAAVGSSGLLARERGHPAQSDRPALGGSGTHLSCQQPSP